MERDAAYWIHHLKLAPHPEGGYFRETYRATEDLSANQLPPRFGGTRSISTAIYFLLENRQISRFHRIKSDEIWHFYDGGSATLHVIDAAGAYSTIALGLDDAATARPTDWMEGVPRPTGTSEKRPQAVIRAGCWLGATADDVGGFALVGCTVAPGFDFKDFELAERGKLLREFPSHRDIIERLT